MALLSWSHCICFITVVYHCLFEQINDDGDDDVLLAVVVDESGKVTSFIEMSGEALKFHKPGKLPKCLDH